MGIVAQRRRCSEQQQYGACLYLITSALRFYQRTIISRGRKILMKSISLYHLDNIDDVVKCSIDRMDVYRVFNYAIWII